MTGQDARSAADTEQLELVPVPRCDFCGPLTAHKQGDIYLHKCGCPFRTEAYCQAHKQGCGELEDIRNGTERFSSQLRELPGETWADIFRDAA